MRLYRVIKKEALDFLRDRGFILTLILEPLILILVFGYTFQADINHLNTIIIDNDTSDYSQKVITAINGSEYFNIIEFSGSLEQAKEKLDVGEARAVFYIPQDFDDKLKNATKAEIYLFIDSSDYTIYNILKGASGQIIKESLQDIVKLIVQDLESEKNLKQDRVNEIQGLVDGISEKADSTLSKVTSLTAQFGEIRSLLNDTGNKIDSSNLKIENISLKIVSLRSELNSSVATLTELNTALLQIKSSYPNSSQAIDQIVTQVDALKLEISNSSEEIDFIDPSKSIQISREYYNYGTFNEKINANEAEVSDINRTAHELKQTYDDIKGRMDTIHLELKTLNDEFLSFPMDIHNEYMYSEISYFQYLTPAILTLILFFIGVVLTTMNIVDERNSKTLFRIATTPIKKWELFGGKFIVFFIVGVIEAFYVLLLAVFLFQVKIAGSITNVFVVLIFLMAASIGLGLLVSTIVKTMRQAIMLVPLVLIPAVLISQTFSPIEVMPRFMQYISYISPMFYSNVALREIMIKGTGLSGVLPQIIILAVYAAITLIIGVLISKKKIE